MKTNRGIFNGILAGLLALPLALLLTSGVFALASEKWDAKLEVLNPSEIEASSMLIEPGFSHSPYNLFNNDMSDCWTEGADGNGTGEFLNFFFTDDVVLTQVRVLTGFHKSEKLFWDNGAPTKLRFTCNDYSETFDLTSQAYTFYGEDAWTTLYFQTPIRPRPWGLTMVVDEVREGDTYPDTCISAMEFYGVDLDTSENKYGFETDAETGGGAVPKPSLMQYQVGYLADFACQLYKYHLELDEPVDAEISVDDLTVKDKAFGLYWYLYNQIDYRCFVDDEWPNLVAIDVDDVYDIITELYGSLDIEVWQEFYVTYCMAQNGHIVYVNGTGDFGATGPFYFENYYNDGYEGKNYLTIRGDVYVYSYWAGEYVLDEDKPYRIFFEPSEGNALFGWTFASVRVGNVY